MVIKKISYVCAFLASLLIVSPVFAATAVVDADRILMEYVKAKNAAIQFQAQEQTLQNSIIDAQNKIKNTKSPVEKKNLEAKYDKILKEQAAKMQKAQIEKLKEINSDVMAAIEKVNSGKYDVILKKSATLYCKNDITTSVLNQLNGIK